MTIRMLRWYAGAGLDTPLRPELLTNRLVNSTRRRRDSQAAVFRAAVLEFAQFGYDAARVDRIAARARVNKAMIYYHYGSKPSLYLEVVRDMLRAVSVRARAIAEGPVGADAKLDAWILVIVEEAAARPWFPPIMLRELASGAEHIDADTFAMMNTVFLAFHSIFLQGRQEGLFREADPLLTYFTILPSILIFFARQRVLSKRRKVQRLPAGAARSVDDFLQHMRSTARLMLRRDT